MRESKHASRFTRELESIFDECQKNINEAVKDYEKDLHVAMEELKIHLSKIS